MLGRRERTKEETHMYDAPYFCFVFRCFSYVAHVGPSFYVIFCRTSVFWRGFHRCFEGLGVTRPSFHLGAPKKRKVATRTNSYRRYGGILLQKVASGDLVHFVQDGSSKNILEHMCLHNNLTNHKITRPSFHLGAPKNVQLWQNQIHIKYTGKSSSIKLPRVIYYTLGRMVSSKTHTKQICFTQTYKIIEIQK